MSERLPSAAPSMLGFGLTVLGVLMLVSTSVLLGNSDLSGISGDAVAVLASVYLLGGMLSIGGGYLAIGSLTEQISLYSEQPGWAWFSAIASLLGGLSAIGAVAMYFVDEEFGDDSAVFALAAAGLYTATIFTVLTGYDETGGNALAAAPFLLRSGAGLSVSGSF